MKPFSAGQHDYAHHSCDGVVTLIELPVPGILSAAWRECGLMLGICLQRSD